MADNARFQVFVSSTFHDLVAERSAVQDAILSLKHFPIGMELFPASDQSAWQLIESVITESDYYVVVVGGRYGSVDQQGISYTEREYDLAAKLGKPVLPFVHGAPDTLPRDHTETDAAAYAKLIAFRDKLKAHHHCKYWHNAGELKTTVLLSLINAFNSNPMPGWIRNSGPPKTELLERLAELQAKYDDLEDKYRRLKDLASDREQRGDNISALAKTISLEVIGPNKSRHNVDVELRRVFTVLAPRITGPTQEIVVHDTLQRQVVQPLVQIMFPHSGENTVIYDGAVTDIYSFRLNSNDLSKLSIPFISSGLVTIDRRMDSNNRPDQYWCLTQRGAQIHQMLTASA